MLKIKFNVNKIYLYKKELYKNIFALSDNDNMKD